MSTKANLHIKQTVSVPKSIGILIVGLVLLVSCSPGVPKEYIQPDQLELILYDFHVADGMAATSPGQKDMTVAYRAAVLKKYGVSQAEFDASMVYYLSHAEDLRKIYERISQRLQEESTALGGGGAALAGNTMFGRGDTANIWSEPAFLILSGRSLTSYKSFELKADTAYHAGDMFQLSFDSRFLFQDGMRDGVAVLAVQLKNDSVAYYTQRFSGDMKVQLSISDDLYVGIKAVRGYMLLNKSLNNFSATTMRLMFLENIRLLRIHRKKPESKALEGSETRKDSLSGRHDTVRRENSMIPKNVQ